MDKRHGLDLSNRDFKVIVEFFKAIIVTSSKRLTR